VQGLAGRVFHVPAQPLTADLAARKLGLDASVAAELVDVLLRAGVVDVRGSVQLDARGRSAWRGALESAANASAAAAAERGAGGGAPSLHEALEGREEAVGQLLAVCRAQHAVVSDVFGDVLAWMMGPQADAAAAAAGAGVGGAATAVAAAVQQPASGEAGGAAAGAAASAAEAEVAVAEDAQQQEAAREGEAAEAAEEAAGQPDDADLAEAEAAELDKQRLSALLRR
jgi:hypothetical protein